MSNKTPEELYKEREKRIDDATRLKIPDRVPVAAVDNGISGITWKEAMYDAQKLIDSRKKRIIDFDVDAFMLPALAVTGQTCDALDFKLYGSVTCFIVVVFQFTRFSHHVLLLFVLDIF